MHFLFATSCLTFTETEFENLFHFEFRRRDEKDPPLHFLRTPSKPPSSVPSKPDGKQKIERQWVGEVKGNGRWIVMDRVLFIDSGLPDAEAATAASCVSLLADV